MVAITLLIGAAAALSHPVLPARPASRLRTISLEKFDIATCKSGTCDGDAGARYRLARSDGPTVSAKDRAFAEDGTRCGLMGPSACPANTHAILHAGEDPVRTIASSLGMN